MAVFILETDNPSRRIVRLLFYVSSINTGRTTTSTESASEEASKTPSTCSRVFSKTETFSFEYGYRPHVTGVFGHRKRRFSNTLSRVEIKTEIHRIRVDGRKQRFSNTMRSYLGSRLALPHIRLENATCGRRYF